MSALKKALCITPLVFLSLTACSQTPPVTTSTAPQTPASADSTMKADAVTSLAQINGWLIDKPQSTPPTAQDPSPPAPSSSISSNTSGVPQTLTGAAGKLTMLATTDTVTDYSITGLVDGKAVASTSICVAIGRSSTAVKGTQSAWVIRMTGDATNTSLLIPGITSCAQAVTQTAATTPIPSTTASTPQPSTTETTPKPIETGWSGNQQEFTTWVSQIPVDQLTPLGKVVAKVPVQATEALSKGITVVDITNPLWLDSTLVSSTPTATIVPQP